MISSHRLKSAYTQGQISAIQTKCCPERAELRYYVGSAQHKQFCKGWNSIFKPFRKMLTPAHKAIKYSE